MVLFNYSTREITAKIVYYGPGLCGKTTNLQRVHARLDPQSRGKLLSLATETDRTLFFDFLPLDLGRIGGFHVRFQLYTVPGQVHYNATRRMVLKGVDAVVFVADSQMEMLEHNRESWENLADNLIENGYRIENVPLVVQMNKRDLPNVASPQRILEAMGAKDVQWFEAVATTGEGVFETLRAILKSSVAKLRTEFKDQGLAEPAVDGFGPSSPPPRPPPVPQPLVVPGTPMMATPPPAAAPPASPAFEAAESGGMTGAAGSGTIPSESKEAGGAEAEEELGEISLEDEISIDEDVVDILGEGSDGEEPAAEGKGEVETKAPVIGEDTPAAEEAAHEKAPSETGSPLEDLAAEVTRLREENVQIRRSISRLFEGIARQVEILREMTDSAGGGYEAGGQDPPPGEER